MVTGGRGFVVVAALALAAAGASCSGDDSDGQEPRTASDDSAQVAEEWLHLGRDLGNSRAATGDEVGADNVATLAPVWELSDIKGLTGTPVVVDGTVYVGSWDGHVRALDAETGDAQWDTDVESYYLGGSVALDEDHVFVAAFDQRVIALDRVTGDQLWETRTGDHPAGAFFGSPIYVDGMVIVGAASFEELIDADGVPTFRGYVMALDAATGEEAWRFWTTAADATEGPGVPMWGTVTVDEERGHVYVPTGNNYAPPMSPRADAILTLDLQTGDELWATQFTEDDTWTLDTMDGPDADVGAPPNLFEVDGTDAVGVGDKAGVYHALDRDTGEEIWSTEMTTGGLQGGVLASAAAVEDTIYVASNKESQNADLLAIDDDSGEILWQVDVGAHMAGPVSWADGVVFLANDSGAIVGYSAEDGSVLWSYEVEDGAAGGISVVDGTVYAGWGYWFTSPPPDPKGGLIAFRPTGGSDADAADEGDEGDEGEDAARSGAEIYEEHCSACHGDNGEGGSGPSLEGIADRLTLDEQLEVVRDGRGNMPDWEGTLTDEEIQAVVDYQRNVLSNG